MKGGLKATFVPQKSTEQCIRITSDLNILFLINELEQHTQMYKGLTKLRHQMVHHMSQPEELEEILVLLHLTVGSGFRKLRLKAIDISFGSVMLANSVHLIARM